MAETVKKEWITEANGTKVAPKTVLSQVLNNDGTSFEARFINVEQGVGGPVVLKDRANEISGTFDLHGENYISSLKIDNSKVEMSAPALSIHDNAAGDTSTSITMSGMAINEHARNGITLDSEKGVEITSKDDEYNNWGFVKVSASDAVEIKANRSNNTAVGDVVIQANNKISDIAKDISETASNSLEIKAISEYNNKGDVSIEGTNSVSIKSQDISITADSQFSNRGRLDISSSDDLSMEVGGDTSINSVGGISVNSEEGNIGLSTNSGDINITSDDLSLNGKNDTSITAGNKLGISSEDYIEINADKSIAITGADGDVSIASESGKVQIFTNDEDIVIAPDGSGNVSIAPYSGDINLTTGNGGTAYYNGDEIATVGYVESLPQINAVSITDTRVTLAGRTKDAYLTSMNNATVQAANGKAEIASMAGNTNVSAYGNVSVEGTTGYVSVKGATGITMQTPFGLSMTADRGIGIKSNSDGVTIEGAGASVSATGNLTMSGNYIQVTANNKNLTMASNNKNVNIYADNGEINLNAPSVNINGEDISGLKENVDNIISNGSKNLIDIPNVQGNGDINAFDLMINLEIGTYTLSFDNSNPNGACMFLGSLGSTLIFNPALDCTNHTTFTVSIEQGGEYRIWLYFNNPFNVHNIMLSKSNTEVPYEPYYLPLTNIKERSNDQEFLGWTVPVECPIKNYVDSNGDFHQRVGRVDLGSSTWVKQNTSSGNWRFNLQPAIDIKAPTSNGEVFKGFIKNYSIISANAVWLGNKGIACNISQELYLCDNSYSDANALKSAMSGKYLYYELATEIVIKRGNEAVTGLKSDLTPMYRGVIHSGDNVFNVEYNQGYTVYVGYGTTELGMYIGCSTRQEPLDMKAISASPYISSIQISVNQIKITATADILCGIHRII